MTPFKAKGPAGVTDWVYVAGFFFPPPGKKGRFSGVGSVPAGSVPPMYLITDVEDALKKGISQQTKINS